MKAEAVASVTIKPLMPVRAARRPLTSPPRTPIPIAIGTASHSGTPKTSIMPPNRMATMPPSAPTERFICPTASVTICAKATMMLTQTLRSST